MACGRADSNGDSYSSNQWQARRSASTTAQYARTILVNSGYARPEKQTVASHATIAATMTTGTYLSQISHGLTGRYWTMASTPDSQQGADLRF